MGARTENSVSRRFLSIHQLVFLICCLCVAPSATQERNTSCIVQPVELYQDTVLTCFFPEDLNITKKDFSVHHNYDFDAMIDCWWLRGNMSCSAKPGIVYPISVSKTFQIHLINVTSASTGTYACKVANYDPTLSQECQLIIKTSSMRKKNYTAVILVAVTVAGVLTLVTLTGFIVYTWRRRLIRCSQECHPMIEIQNKSEEVTETFQEFLLQNVKQTFPSMPDGYYFVPPVYFNKVRYRTQSVVGQVVHIPDLPDESDIRRDRAMKDVLDFLRGLAEDGQEQMFVLTQFYFNDNLNKHGHLYRKHSLPVLAGFKSKNKNRHIGCFDVLIIHRQFGLVIGVVRSLNDKDDDSQDGERRTDDQLAIDISEGIEQLKKADREIEYFISDQQPSPPIRLTLMLPNVARSTLQRVLSNHRDVAQNLCYCMKTIDWTTQLCLCADDLRNALPPWDVDPTVMIHLRNWWGHLIRNDVDGAMSDELYQTMIARFCGLATSSGSDILRGSSFNQLLKTVDKSIFMTGDLFERLTLYPDMVELLDRPQMLLTGPPGTGKSRMLELVGRKWITQGHIVYIINTWSNSAAATIQLERLLQQTPLKRGRSAKDMVISTFCNIDDEKEIDTAINALKDDARTRKIPIFAVLDELGHDLEKSRQGTSFLRKLLEIPDIHLWAATCRSDILPDGYDGKSLTETLSCPPSVVREAQKYVIPVMSQYTSSNRQTPTDGLPVNNFHHQGQGHQQKEPRDCNACGEAVVQFLKATVNDKEKENPTGDQATCRQPPSVQWKDILILFETKFTENVPLMKCLLNSGIPAHTISYGNQEKILKSDTNTVLVAKAGFLCGLKRKMVVYVEGSINRSDDSTK